MFLKQQWLGTVFRENRICRCLVSLSLIWYKAIMAWVQVLIALVIYVLLWFCDFLKWNLSNMTSPCHLKLLLCTLARIYRDKVTVFPRGQVLFILKPCHYTLKDFSYLSALTPECSLCSEVPTLCLLFKSSHGSQWESLWGQKQGGLDHEKRLPFHRFEFWAAPPLLLFPTKWMKCLLTWLFQYWLK